jgi:hypothetical protein
MKKLDYLKYEYYFYYHSFKHNNELNSEEEIRLRTTMISNTFKYLIVFNLFGGYLNNYFFLKSKTKARSILGKYFFNSIKFILSLLLQQYQYPTYLILDC